MVMNLCECEEGVNATVNTASIKWAWMWCGCGVCGGEGNWGSASGYRVDFFHVGECFEWYLYSSFLEIIDDERFVIYQ